MHPNSAIWDTSRHQPLLGSLLMFRKAIENLCVELEVDEFPVRFVVSDADVGPVQRIVGAVFEDCRMAPCSFSSSPASDRLWPEDQSTRWYSSWYGIQEQCESRGATHVIQWQDAPSGYSDCFSCHLKIYSDPASADIDQASLSQWQRFFAAEPERKFIFLGNDPYPDDILSLPNVIQAQDIGLSLNQQLSLIPSTRGFIGSASGFSSAAVMSRIPYTIFKHPEHHPGEFLTPSFQGAHQKIIRAIDDFDTIRERFLSWAG